MIRLKRVVAICMVLAVSLVSFQVMPAKAAKLKKEQEHKEDKISGKCGEKAEFKLEGGVLTISGSGICNNNDNNWDKSLVTKVVVEKGITGIAASTFAGCVNLTEVDIAPTVTQIRSKAFSGCSSLKSVTINSKGKVTTDRNSFEGFDGTVYCYTASKIITKNLSTNNIKYLDKNIECRFYIRKDNSRPDENGNTSYDTKLYFSAGSGVLKEAKKVFSSVEDVEANIAKKPDVSKYLGENQKVNWYVIKLEDDGWHVDGVITSEESTVIPDEGDVKIKNIALYYNVNADKASLGDGYTLNDGVYEDSKKYNKGDEVTVIAQKPVRKGYKFAGWSTNANAGVGDSLYKPGSSFKFPDVTTLTLYAVWQKGSTLSYNVNADDAAFGEGSHTIIDGVYTDPTEHYSGEEITIIGEQPKREGYTFVGWSTKADETDTGKMYNADNSKFTYPDTDSLTLYAIWSKDEEGSTYPVVLAGICVLIVIGSYGYIRKRKNVN